MTANYLPGVEWECECSEECGPCEEHGETVVQREGASIYTPVELLALYADDATDCGTELSPWALGLIREARTMTDEHRAGLRDELTTLADQMECDMSTLDAPHFTYWDDGFRMGGHYCHGRRGRGMKERPHV